MTAFALYMLLKPTAAPGRPQLISDTLGGATVTIEDLHGYREATMRLTVWNAVERSS